MFSEALAFNLGALTKITGPVVSLVTLARVKTSGSGAAWAALGLSSAKL
jgi:hypothetical protein